MIQDVDTVSWTAKIVAREAEGENKGLMRRRCREHVEGREKKACKRVGEEGARSMQKGDEERRSRAQHRGHQQVWRGSMPMGDEVVVASNSRTITQKARRVMIATKKGP